MELLKEIYLLLGLESIPNIGDLIALAASLGIILAALFAFPPRCLGAVIRVENAEELDPTQSSELPESSISISVTPLSFKERLAKGLSKSRKEIWGKLGEIFSAEELSAEQVEQIEELLYAADLGPAMVEELMSKLTEEFSGKDSGQQDFTAFLKKFLSGKMSPAQEKLDQDLFHFTHSLGTAPKVIMIVGVNGAGKTTTIGKLATKLTAQGAKVVVGACDTFRAAAVDQLEIWCERAGATMVRAKEGANPSGVGYQALEQAKAIGADYCILDTAGRLHTKGNLMDELKKSKKVLAKLDEKAPHHTLLVIDAITGQNALRQAEEFNKTLNLTGLIFTKCDGSSKAGSAVAIVDKLKLPIFYIGVGESVEDLDHFNLGDYMDALLDEA